LLARLEAPSFSWTEQANTKVLSRDENIGTPPFRRGLKEGLEAFCATDAGHLVAVRCEILEGSEAFSYSIAQLYGDAALEIVPVQIQNVCK
jgi:hypothetical protein